MNPLLSGLLDAAKNHPETFPETALALIGLLEKSPALIALLPVPDPYKPLVTKHGPELLALARLIVEFAKSHPELLRDVLTLVKH